MSERNSRRNRVATAGVAACLTILVAASAAFAASSGSGGLEASQGEPVFGGAPVMLTDCATTDFTVLLTGEVNTAFDTESRVLELSALGPDGVDVSFFVSVDDPTCRSVPALVRQIASALQEAARIHAADCASVTQDLAAPEQAQAAWAARGITWTPEAAQQFLAESCGQPLEATPSP